MTTAEHHRNDDPSAAAGKTPAGPGEVRIGPPGVARAGGAVFAIVWTVVIVVFFVNALRNGATAPLLVLPVFLVFGLGIVWRNNSLGLRSNGDTLTVRGPYSTRRVQRSDIAEVRRGEQTSPVRSPAVVITTKDGDTLIGPPTTLLPFGRGSRAQIDAQVRQVQTWTSGG